jgi:hypothetical protein
MINDLYRSMDRFRANPDRISLLLRFEPSQKVPRHRVRGRRLNLPHAKHLAFIAVD